MEVSGQLNAPAAYPQGNIPWYPLDRRLGGELSRSVRGSEEKNSQTLPGLEPPIIEPSVMPLSYPGSYSIDYGKCDATRTEASLLYLAASKIH
jgi:hypothetical protein